MLENEILTFTLWSCFRFREPGVLHQLKGKRHVVHLLIEILWREEEFVQRDKVSLEKAHNENQIDTIMKLVLQIGHFQVNLIQLFVDKRNQRLLDNLKGIINTNISK